jgi:hypothetical protein
VVGLVEAGDGSRVRRARRLTPRPALPKRTTMRLARGFGCHFQRGM